MVAWGMAQDTSYTLEFYTDAKGEHRWRLTHSNGEIVGASSEGFTDERGAQENAQAVWRGLSQTVPL